MPIESPVLSKASGTLWAFERLLSGVVANVSHKGTFLPEASQAELTHVRFIVAVGPLMHLQGVLSKTERRVSNSTASQTSQKQ